MKIIATYVPDDAQIITLQRVAQSQGGQLFTRYNPRTRRQQTVIAITPLAGWHRLRIHEKQAAA